MVQSIGAVIGGFLIMAVLVVVTTAVASAALLKAPEPNSPQKPNAVYLAANLICSFLAALAGGYACCWIAPYAPMNHAVALAILMAVMSVLTAITSRPNNGQPQWYPWVIAVIGVTGILAGAASWLWFKGSSL